MPRRLDYLIIGAGPYGATFARSMRDRGFSCLVIDRRSHVAGNTFDSLRHGVRVHRYGPHAFHTNSRRVWRFITQFSEFENGPHTVLGTDIRGLYHLPIGMPLMRHLWGVETVDDARREIVRTREPADRNNAEGWCLRTIGRDLYEASVKYYTARQWGRPCTEVPASIVRRLKVRLNWDVRYFGDRYEGLPREGYTKLFDRMLDDIPVELGVDVFSRRGRQLRSMARTVVYSGPLDKLFGYAFGQLDYRSLRFTTGIASRELGARTVNNNTPEGDWSRVSEWNQWHTTAGKPIVHTYEYPQPYEGDAEPFYPVPDGINRDRRRRYLQAAKNDRRLIIGGRLGTYRYMNMDQVIGQALSDAARVAA